MALSVAEKMELVKMIEARVDKQIENLRADHKAEIEAMSKKAYPLALGKLGVVADVKQLIALEAQIEELTKRANKIEKRVFAFLNPGDEGYRHNTRGQITESIEETQKRLVDALIAKTAWGKEIERLQAERVGVKTALLLATSNKQVKDLWVRVTSIIGDAGSNTDLTTEALNIK